MLRICDLSRSIFRLQKEGRTTSKLLSTLSSKVLPISQEALEIDFLHWRKQSTRSREILMSNSSILLSPHPLMLCLLIFHAVIFVFRNFEPCGYVSYYGTHGIFSLLMNHDCKIPANSVIQHLVAFSPDFN